MRHLHKIRNIFVEEGLLKVAGLDYYAIAQEYLTALKKVPAPESWMRYKRVKVEARWNSISAHHGYIPRELRHSGEGQVSPEVEEAYDDWEDGTSDVISAFGKKYPGVDFGTEHA